MMAIKVQPRLASAISCSRQQARSRVIKVPVYAFNQGQQAIIGKIAREEVDKVETKLEKRISESEARLTTQITTQISEVKASMTESEARLSAQISGVGTKVDASAKDLQLVRLVTVVIGTIVSIEGFPAVWASVLKLFGK